jgi:peptidoglycan hydrolase CwlO-like protein
MKIAKDLLTTIIILVIIIIITLVTYYITNYSTANYNNYNNYNKNQNSIERFGINTTQLQNTIPLIANSVKDGYDKMKKIRFKTIDNQIKLDNLGARINKLLDNIQNTYNLVNNQSLKMPMTFY